MSASYGNYLTEEDPNKRKLSEGTTPSTTPTTATGGTTTPPLTYEGFVGTGSGSQAYQTNVGYVNDQYNASVNAANTNKQTGTQYAQAQKDSIYGAANTNKELGMSYAEGVKNSIYGNAAAQRAEADKNTEAARQRGIIDSQSSYQKAVGAYGSNAETLAGRGLSGSGYGEYLTADAYATHRGQVQNINADALRANREAAYAESQAKMAADSEYLKNLYGINTEYNKAVSGADSEYLKNLYGINTEYNAAMNKAESDRTTGMYQAALGLNEAQNTAYGKLFDSASKGVSIDAIMQDGTWGDLTPEQQKAITAEAERFANDKSVNEFKGLIDGGTSLEEIQQSEAWSKLTPAQQTDVTNYYNNKQSGDALETDSNYLGLLSDINSGALTIGAIKNTAMWNTLSKPQQAQLEAAATLRGKTETKDRMGVYADLATKGVSLEDIKTMMAINGDTYVEELTEEKYNALTDEQKAEYNEARNFMKLIESRVKTYADAQDKLNSESKTERALGYADLAENGYSIDDIKSIMAMYGDQYISKKDYDKLSDEEKAKYADARKYSAVIDNAVGRYNAAQEKIKSDEMTDRYFGYSELAAQGYSIDDIKAMMGIYGDQYISAEEYEKLDDDGKKAKAEARKYSALIDTALGRYSSAQEKLESENEMERALGYVGLLESGWTLDDVTALIGGENAFKEMGAEAQALIKKSSEVIGNLKTEAAGKDAKGALAAYIEAAGEGLSIDAITAIAMANGHYDVLVGEKGTEEGKTLWDAVVAEAEKLTNQNATNDTLTNIENAIKDGATLEDLQGMEGWDDLSTEEQDAYKEQIADRDQEKKTQREAVSAGLRNAGYTSASEVEDYLASEGVPESERAEYVAQWQSDNSKRVMDTIKLDIFEVDVEILVDGLKHGAYGDQAQAVKEAYCNAAIKATGHSQTTLGEILELREVVNAIGSVNMQASLREEINKRVVSRTGAIPTYATDGKPIKQGAVVNDAEAKEILDAFASSATNAYIEFNGSSFCRISGAWYEMSHDTSRGYKEPTGSSSSSNQQSYAMSDYTIAASDMNFDKKGAKLTINGTTVSSKTKGGSDTQASLNKAFPDAEAGTVVTKGNVIYAKLADGSWYILK